MPISRPELLAALPYRHNVADWDAFYGPTSEVHTVCGINMDDACEHNIDIGCDCGSVACQHPITCPICLGKQAN